MDADLPTRLQAQLDEAEVGELLAVLGEMPVRVRTAVGDALVGVYLTGSLALGCGDVHADVDFLVATNRQLSPSQQASVRGLHRELPARHEHWAHVLEGSYASLDDLRERAAPSTPWLYVDNGSRDMEWSAHDNTEVLRWVLHHRAVAVDGPPASTLVDDPPPLALRHEAADLAVRRTADIAADPDYLRTAWGQPHEVLTRCRMLFTATRAEVAGKTDAAVWCKSVVPTEWHDLIDRAIAARPNPAQRLRQPADPALMQRTWEFVELITPMIAKAAS